MVRRTGQRQRSTLPAGDTPGAENTRSGASDSQPHADLAAAAWRSLAPSLAGTPHVRISKDAGRTYPARYSRPLPAEPPLQPSTVPVYDAGLAAGRMLVLDLGPARCLSQPAVTNAPPGGRKVTGACDAQAAELGQLLERLDRLAFRMGTHASHTTGKPTLTAAKPKITAVAVPASR